MYYNKAKQMGYRSRASFKLQYINEKYHIIKKGDVVVDLGAAPGGWLQVAKELSEGTVIGVDLQKIEPLEGVTTIKGDMTSDRIQAKIFEMVDEVDVVICDAAPNLSGNWALDHARSIELSRRRARRGLPSAQARRQLRGQGLPGRYVRCLFKRCERALFVRHGVQVAGFSLPERRDLRDRQGLPYDHGAERGYGRRDRSVPGQ